MKNGDQIQVLVSLGVTTTLKGNPLTKSFLSFGMALGLAAALAQSAQGAVLVTPTNESTQTAAAMYSASGSDLIDQSQAATFLSQSVSGFGPVFAPATALNDGTAGTYGADFTNGIYSSTVPFTTTFHLQTAVATSGYDISRIQTLTSWGDDKQGQSYAVYYSTVASNPANNDITGYTALTSVNYAGVAVTGGGAVRVTLDITGLSGVNAIQFVVGSWNGYSSSVWREIDAFGTAVFVPEPGALSLLGLGGLALLRRRRATKEKCV